MASNAIDLNVRIPNHDDFVTDGSTFWVALQKFHSDMGSQIRAPVIAKTMVNLHLLYVEVTKLGGYDKVVRQRKWKEVSIAFMIPPSATNALHVLKKTYFKTLYKFEQLYYTAVPWPLYEQGYVIATGTIDAEFNGGYMVSIQVGPEILKGILFRIQDEALLLPGTTSTTSAPPTPPHTAPSRRVGSKRAKK